MRYSELCEVYEELSRTTKKLEKTEIISILLKKLTGDKELGKEIIYLLLGRITPDYEKTELGISDKLVIKAISKASGMNDDEVINKWKKTGDLGEVAEELLSKKKQSTLTNNNTKELTINKVLDNFKKLPTLEGKGAVEKKLLIIAELLLESKGVEAKYLVRTLLEDLRVGVAGGIIRDAIVKACLTEVGEDKEVIKEKALLVQKAYDLTTDFGLVYEQACEGIDKLEEIGLIPGRPVKVMLFPKAKDISDAFRIIGRPAAFEYKYDGFRVIISKYKGKISVYTRRLEEVSKQFPEIVKYANEHVNAESFMIDAEAVGYDPETKAYRPFQEISQRIKRKYDIEMMAKELPVEIEAFDLIYLNGKSLIKKPFIERRELLVKIITPKDYELRLSEQIITDDEEVVEEFYDKALEIGEEGVMGKNLQAPYKPGARIGYAVKLKPEAEEFDLVITKAEWGTGKRGKWLTSYTVSCYDTENEGLLEVGKVSTGLKEKPEEGLSFKEMTEKLQDLIIREEGRTVIVKPLIVGMVEYQNIQKSPTYNSGYALRFPRIKRLRPDKKPSDITTIKEIIKEFLDKQRT